jgi:hypothetical protein
MASTHEDETGLEVLEQRVAEELGRELTAREKFHLAFSEACAASRTRQMSAKGDIAQLEAMAREEQEQIKRRLQRTVRIFKQSQLRQ